MGEEENRWEARFVINKQIVISTLTLCILFSSIIYIPVGDELLEQGPIVLSFFLIGLVSAINISQSITRDLVSIDLIHWFFIFVFFGLAAPLKLATNNWRYPITEELIFWANLAIIVWIICYKIGYTAGRCRTDRSIPDYDLFTVRTYNASKIAVGLSIPSLLLSIVLLVWLGPSSFLTRATFRNTLEVAIGMSAAQMLIIRFVRPLLLLSAIVAISVLVLNWFEENPQSEYILTWILALFAVGCGILVNFPTGSARLWAFGVLFGGGLLLTMRWINNGQLYLIILFAGTFISSLFNIFRYATNLGSADLSAPSLTQYITSNNFDAYENLLHVIQYTGSQGYSYGWNLLGGFLFWVPRALWEGKPVGTGVIVSRHLESLGVTIVNWNIAIPLVGEAWVNFGLFGVVVYATSYGFAISKVDQRFSKGIVNIRHDDGLVDLFPILLAMGLGIFLIHFRGGFLATFGMVAMYCYSMVVILIFAKMLDC